MELINPFTHSIVTDAWQAAESDVPIIHADMFELCCSVLEQVRQSGGSRSLVLHGLPGSGKTHLLARFRTSLTGAAPEAASPLPVALPPNALFIAVRLRAGARMLCRHLRRTLATDVFRPTRLGMSQLEQLLVYRYAQHLKDRKQAQAWWLALRQPAPERRWWQWWRNDERGAARREVEAMVDRLDDQLALGRNLNALLKHLALGSQRRSVRDWLHDGALPEASLQELGLVAPPDEEDPEEQALDMVCALSRLADASVPLVLCFDQVEALQTAPEDMEGLHAFGRMVSTLRDKTRNTLLISCVQTAFLDQLGEIIRGADLDRLTEQEGLLKPLSKDQAERLVAVRLDSSPELAGMRRNQAGKLWPLKPHRISELMDAAGSCTPRQLIAYCGEEFEKWRQGQTQPAASLEEFLALQFRIELDQALRDSLPARTDDTLAHGLPLLVQVLKQGRAVMERDQRHIDLCIELPAGRRYISYCNQVGNPFTVRLGKLRERVEQGTLPNLLLVRDSRLPISKYAKKAQEHLEVLEHAGVPLVRPEAAGIAALEAFRSLLSDAKSGDLARRGEAVSPECVQDWLAQHLPEALSALLGQMLPSELGMHRDTLYDELLELVQSRRVLRVEEAAQRLAQSVEALEACVRRHPAELGLLHGPPPVVFERLAVAPGPA
ncbi:MAG: hypothetical protein ACREWG_05815 [Gammaproteobacteria bacterium]